MGQSIGVVVPAYNEGEFIGDVIDTVPAFVDRIYVVDDCSDDNTWNEIQARAGERTTGSAAPVETTGPSGTVVSEPDVSISDGGRVFENEIVSVRHETNRGRGGAVKTGYKLALVDGMNVVAVMDGDGQMDPAILDDIIAPVADGEADYAKGSRLSESAHWRQMPKWRLFGNALLTVLTKIASGYWRIRDPQNGYTAISADTLRQCGIDDLYEEYGFLNHLLIRLSRYNATVTDVTMPAKYGDESSGIRYRTFVPRLSLLLLRGFLYRLCTKIVPLDRD